MTYEVVVTNGTVENGSLTNVVITDNLPTGLTYKTGSFKVGGEVVDDTGIWTDNKLTYTSSTTLQGGESVSIQYTVTVITNIAGNLKNVAIVTGKDMNEENSYTTEDSETIEVDSKPVKYSEKEGGPSTGDYGLSDIWLVTAMSISSIVGIVLKRRKEL